MSNAATIIFSSLGMSCQTTHQIRRFAAGQVSEAIDITMQSGPIDWLICPPDSLSDWLDDGLPLFEPGEIVEYRGHAYWSRYRFWFWHGFFKKTEEGKVLDIKATSQRELEKLAYQRGKFAQLPPESTRFVISNVQNNLETDVFCANENEHFRFNLDKMDRLQSSLDRFFKAQCSLTMVSRADRCDDKLAVLENVFLLQPDLSEWKGDPRYWAPVLNTLIPR